MIYFEERPTVKLPGKTSLFVSFNYRKDFVDIIKSCYSTNYDKNTHEWEVPIPCLSYLIDRFSNLDDIKVSTLPEATQGEFIKYSVGPFKTKPYSYQEDAVQYGLNHDKWLLLDSPGLGKSKMIIDLANELKKRDNIQHCLIVCGINTLKFNWLKEIKIHSDLSARILGQRLNRKGEIKVGGTKERLADLKSPIDEFFVITNIESLREEDIVKEITSGKNNIFDMAVVDEFHRAKNPSASQSKGVLKIKSKFKVGATGTLMLNSPEDCYLPLKWIGADRSTFTNFKYFYEIFGGPFNNELIGYRNMNILKDQIEENSLRRTKDLLDLPEKTVIVEEIEMNDNQVLFYNNIKQGIIDQVDKVEMSTANLLATVARLRQATVCPNILTTDDIKSSKIERAVDLTEQLINNGEKVVIFSTFKEPLKYLAKDLKDYNPLICTGDIKDNEISKSIDLFQNDPNYKVILATTQKLGTGVTLTAASYMIFLDTPWTSGDFEQASDRIHRVGSKRPVFIYNLVCKDTIDEHVLELVNDKGAMSDYIIDDKIANENALNSLRKYIEELK